MFLFTSDDVLKSIFQLTNKIYGVHWPKTINVHVQCIIIYMCHKNKLDTRDLKQVAVMIENNNQQEIDL